MIASSSPSWGLILASIRCALAFVLIVLGVTAISAYAQTIDLSLNIEYNVKTNTTLGGNWTVVGKSDSSGIASASFLLTGIATANAAGPAGIVNGIDPAGFNFFNETGGAANEIAAFQIPLGPQPLTSGEQNLFYGVGSMADGMPGDIGPTFTTLTNTTGVPWGVTGSDFLDDPTWDIAVPLATGEFAPGQTPDFVGADPITAAGIFTSLGTSTMAGTIEQATTETFIVRSDRVVLGGDFNGDGRVTLADYPVWRNSLGTADETPILDNGDGMNGVDPADYLLWKANFGMSLPGAGSGAGIGAAAAIPEPSAAILALLGSLGWAFSRKKPGFFRLG